MLCNSGACRSWRARGSQTLLLTVCVDNAMIIWLSSAFSSYVGLLRKFLLCGPFLEILFKASLCQPSFLCFYSNWLPLGAFLLFFPIPVGLSSLTYLPFISFRWNFPFSPYHQLAYLCHFSLWDPSPLHILLCFQVLRLVMAFLRSLHHLTVLITILLLYK